MAVRLAAQCVYVQLAKVGLDHGRSAPSAPRAWMPRHLVVLQPHVVKQRGLAPIAPLPRRTKKEPGRQHGGGGGGAPHPREDPRARCECAEAIGEQRGHGENGAHGATHATQSPAHKVHLPYTSSIFAATAATAPWTPSNWEVHLPQSCLC
jgi:hypothetical protein